MKTKIYLLATLLAATSAAHSSNIAPTQNVLGDIKEPLVALGSVEQQNGISRINIDNTTVSRRQNGKICWVSQNINLGETQVKETLSVPLPGFNKLELMPNMTTVGQHIADGYKIYEFTRPISPNQAGQYFSCWAFEDSDPIGEYKISLQIGETYFPTLKFNVSK